MDLASNPSECQIFHLFRCDLSSLLPLRCAGKSNFDKGLHNLITLIKKRYSNNDIVDMCDIDTVDSYGKTNIMSIYVCLYVYITY